MTFWFSAQWREILLFLKQYENKKCFYKSRYILDKYEKAPFKIFLTNCTPPLICDDWPKIITPCTSSTRLDFFCFVFQFDSTIKNSSDSSSMIWASSQSFCTKLIFAKKLQSFMTPLNEWFGLQTSTIAMILYNQFVNKTLFSSFSSTCFSFTYRSDRWLHEELWQLNEGN